MNYEEAMHRLERAERRKAVWAAVWWLTRLGCLLIGWGLLLSWWLR